MYGKIDLEAANRDFDKQYKKDRLQRTYQLLLLEKQAQEDKLESIKRELRQLRKEIQSAS